MKAEEIMNNNISLDDIKLISDYPQENKNNR
jgi:hypothetical protein